MIQFKYTPYPKNETLLWSPTDTEERFINNVKNKTNIETTDFYLKNPIEYQFNNCGFRTPDDYNSTDEGNVFLGCSYTVGIGHHLENTWSHKVNEHIGGKFWNMSIAGSGVMAHFRLLLAYHKELKIKNVFHYALKFPRFEFYKENIPFQYDHNYHEYMDFFLDVMAGDNTINLTFASHLLAIQNLCKIIGCNYYYIQECPPEKLKGIKARDLIHPPISWQETIADMFIDKYETNNQDLDFYNTNVLL